MATEEGPDYLLQEVDPADLCFDASALPENYGNHGHGLLDNARMVQSYAGDDRQLADEFAQRFQEWGFVTGYFWQWAEDSEEEARQEIEAAPFFFGSCTVELYQDSQGAGEAFATLSEEVRFLGVPLGPERTSRDIEGPTIGSESREFVAEAGVLRSHILIFRTRNVIGRVVVVDGIGGGDEPVGYTEELAQVLFERIAGELRARD